MFREIRGVRQSKRWFQDAYFDLFLREDSSGAIEWFQLCYARDTWRERVLEWRRGRGFQHLKVKGGLNPARKDSGELVLDGVMPYAELIEHFQTAAPGLPRQVAAFVDEKIREYARPARKFRRAGAKTPRWLERLRRRRFLDSEESGR